jgi:hypothetical protein
MSATALLLVAAMLLMAAIEIAASCCVWMRVDDESCGCWLFDAGVIVAWGCGCCVLCWLREGLCLMLAASGMGRLLFTRQLATARIRVWSYWWLGARTSMLKPSK